MRNRDLSADFQRTLQKDPNQTGLLYNTALLQNAQAPMAFLSVTAGGQYTDGLNPYVPFLSNPITGRDPSGLISINSAHSIHNWYTELGAARRAIRSASRSQDLLWGVDWGDDDYGDAIMDVLADRDFGLATLMQAVQKAEGGRFQAQAYARGAVAWMMEMAMMTPEAQVLTTLPFGAGRAARGLFSPTGLTRQSRFMARAASRKAMILKANAKRGLAYEADVLSRFGWVKNTTRIEHNGVRAIPDVITPTRVIEIKDQIRISQSAQLRTIVDWSIKNGMERPLLVVSPRFKRASKWVTDNFNVHPGGP